MIHTYLFLLLLALGWTINPFLIKKSIGKLSHDEYLIIKSIIVTLFFLLFFLYQSFTTNTSFKKIINKITDTQFKWLIASSILTVFTSVLLIILLKYNNVTYIIPHVKPLTIILSLFVGIYIFKEKLNMEQIFGILLVTLGIFLINYYK